jgi:hypothetical protein
MIPFRSREVPRKIHAVSTTHDDLGEWEARLAAAEAGLRERESRALEGAPTPSELQAFAAEYEKLASDRNAVADAYDAHARGRDSAALTRDVRGSHRDRLSRDYEGDTGPASLDRIVSGVDRDLAAGDRAEALDDRERAARARRQAAVDRQHARDDADAARTKSDEYERQIDELIEALNTRLTIGRAEGLLMAEYDITADAAFRLIEKLAQSTDMDVRATAAHMVSKHESATPGIASDL